MAEDEETTEGSVYGKGREELMEDSEISAEEEAFMEGYDSTDKEISDDTADDAYDKAFGGRKPTKKRSKRDDDVDEDDE